MGQDKSVSILKETRAGERRVIILPREAAKFADAGFRVFVEAEAGVGAGATDDDYRAAGAEIVTTQDAWRLSP